MLQILDSISSERNGMPSVGRFYCIEELLSPSLVWSCWLPILLLLLPSGCQPEAPGGCVCCAVQGLDPIVHKPHSAAEEVTYWQGEGDNEVVARDSKCWLW